MKKYNHPIDDLFRDALKDHRMAPSDAAKKAFLKDAMQLPPPGKQGGRPLTLLSLLLALIGAGILIWAISTDKFAAKPGPEAMATAQSAPAKEPHKTIQPETHGKAEPKPTDKADRQNTVSGTHAPGQTGQSHIHRVSGTTQQQPIHQAAHPAATAPAAPINATTAAPAAKPAAMAATTTTMNQAAAHEQLQEVPAPVAPAVAVVPVSGTVSAPIASATGRNNQGSDTPAENAAVTNGPGASPVIPVADTTRPGKKVDSIVNPVPDKKEKTSGTYRKPANWIPAIGVYYSPEWMFNTLEGSKFVNNFGLEGTFHFGRFSIRTGAGLSIAKGTNELIVEYNEFLGAYNKLDSMDFTWSNPSQQYIPKFYMSNQDVWDSLMKLDYAKVIKRYTYLQIPLILGYDFWQTEKVSIGCRVGPVMSVLLASKQLSAAYDPGKNKVISINDIAPGQVSLNWQLMAGVNTAFRITKELQFEVEPWVRYYFNSVYEKPVNNTKPWSVGVRAALVVKF